MLETPNVIVGGHALLLLLGLPALAVRDARRGADLDHLAAPRLALYLTVGLSLVVMGLVTFGVAAWQDVSPAALRWNVGQPGIGLLWSLAAATVGLLLTAAVARASRRFGWRESAAAMMLMPTSPAQKRGYLILSGVAALCEEYVYRGFALWVVASWTGSDWAGAVVVSVAFGLAHGYQNFVGVLRGTLLGMVLAATVIWSGSLFPGVVGHFWINAAIGMGGWRYLLRESGAVEVVAVEPDGDETDGKN